MGTNILNNEITQTNKIDKKSKNQKVNSKKESTTSSLFDQILSLNKKTITNNNSSSKKNILIKDSPNTKTKEIKEVIIKDTKSKSDNPKLSLLDSMVRNIKVQNSTKNIEKTISKKEIIKDKNTLKKSKSIIKDENKQINKIETTKVNTVKNQEIKLTNNEKIISKNITQQNTEKTIPKTSKKSINLTTEEIIAKKTDNIAQYNKKEKNIEQTNTKSKSIDITDKSNIKTNTQVNVQSVKKLDIKNKEDKSSLELTNESLNDKVTIDENKTEITVKSENTINTIIKQDDIKITKDTKPPANNNSLLNNLILKAKEKKPILAKEDSSKTKENSIKANIFLSDQETKKTMISTQKITEAKKILLNENRTEESIKKSAKTLELNIKEVELIQEDDSIKSKKDTAKVDIKEKYKQQNNILDKMFLNKFQNSQQLDTLKSIDIQSEKKSTEIKSTQTNTKKIEKEIEIVVQNSVVQTITTKIIESKQKLNSFMSEVSRKMYLNYKPPVTAFKINLTPSHLGNISIMMKSNKNDNSMSVSLKMTRQNTLEVFSENRLTLQNALNRSFENNTSVSIDFNMQDSDTNNNFDEFNQEQNQHKSKQIKEDKESIEDKEEPTEDQSYM